MPAVEPARERIARRLQDAVERLRHDMDEVEFWTEVLGCLTRPAPDYSDGTSLLNRFALPLRGQDGPARAHHLGSDASRNKADTRRPDGSKNARHSGH